MLREWVVSMRTDCTRGWTAGSAGPTQHAISAGEPDQFLLAQCRERSGRSLAAIHVRVSRIVASACINVRPTDTARSLLTSMRPLRGPCSGRNSGSCELAHSSGRDHRRRRQMAGKATAADKFDEPGPREPMPGQVNAPAKAPRSPSRQTEPGRGRQ